MLFTVMTYAQAMQRAPDIVALRGPFSMLQAARKVPCNITAVWEVQGVHTKQEAMAAVMEASVRVSSYSHIKVYRLS